MSAPTSAVQNLEIPGEKLAESCRKHHIRKLALFGSVLRDDFGPASDLDVLVEFERGRTPGFGFITLQDELTELLGRRVDLNTPQISARVFGTRSCAEPGSSMLPDQVRLQHILDAARQAAAFGAQHSRADLDLEDLQTQGVIRLLEILGEAAKNVSKPTRALAPAIPWREIAGTGDRLMHGYSNIDLDIVWAILTQDLAPLIPELERLLDTIE